jgi:aminoglycoside phosphotransferase family enzyme
MSWLFLAETLVWKLKKPVRYDYLDFSTPEARRRNCEAEFRLNRRLASDVYLGITSLTLEQSGRMQLDGRGEAIDWLVRMRRLPSERMLDRAIASHTVSDEDARKVGALLARFYREALPVPLTTAEYKQKLAAEIHTSRRELEKPEYALPVELVEPVITGQLEFLDQEAKLLDDRVRAGLIIEAHGDLRPEHICLENRPVIIDCLEFNRDLRILDPASELAFLALECERLGASRTGELILQTYRAETGDRPPERLLIFYRSWHACLRARIAVWHLRDDEVRDPAKWTNKAEQYLQLAARITAVV